jgi:Phage tail tube protein
MTIGTSNRMALRSIAEVTFGTTPANPALQNMRFTGESLNYSIGNTVSSEIRSDRMSADTVQVSADAGGDVNFELSYSAYDEWLAALLCSAWGAPAAGVETLKNGTTPKSFTVQKHIQDITTPAYLNFTGMRAGSMELGFQTGQVVTGKFGFAGLGMVVSTTQISGATTPAAPTKNVMNAVSNIVLIQEDGVTSTNFFNRFSMTVNNNLRPQRAIGNLSNIGIALGKLDITGNIDVYFQDTAMLAKYLAGTPFKISFKMQDSEPNTLIWTLPRVKFESGQVVAGGLDQDLMLTGTWRALYDSGSSCMIQVDRDAAPVGP